MADKKADIYIKGTGIKISCETSEEAFWLYNGLGHKPGFVINGEELQNMGPTESKNPHVKAYFAGYTRDFFKKYFDTPEKESAKYEENLESLQRKAEEKGLYEAPDNVDELEL